ncbi:MAG TPA: cytochrome c-type biogenesis protein [Nevskiaceae bacterium]|nr:cytochrome c-type biogenesis protein [Nevskiaceae bacterium]
MLFSVAQAAELDSAQTRRYQALTQELRCLVCQNQNIADSEAPLAADLRNQVKAQIIAGRSNDEIKQYLTDRYGDFVLYQPPVKSTTWLLWFGPFALVLVALVVALRHIRATHAPRAAARDAAADAAALQKLLDEQK